MNWKAIAKWGTLLGLACEAWTFVMGFTGWYADPALASLFWVVIILNVLVIILALRETRADHRYLKQVATGVLAGCVAAVIIFCGSLLFTTVAFPEYFETVAAMQEQVLTERGTEPAQVKAIADQVRTASPVAQALAGALGTVVTSLVVAAIAAVPYRQRSA